MSNTWSSSDKFNREASLWDDNPQRRALALGVADAIVQAVHPGPALSALEFGCGTGLVTLQISPLVKRLVAVDTSKEMVSVLQKKISAYGIENIETACVDLFSSAETPFGEEHFDLIYSSMALHHIDDTAGSLHCLSNLLSPGGIIAIADLDREDGLFHDDPQEKVHYGFERTALAAQLLAAKLEVTSFETIYTMEKVNRSGQLAAYPIFLVTAKKCQ